MKSRKLFIFFLILVQTSWVLIHAPMLAILALLHFFFSYFASNDVKLWNFISDVWLYYKKNAGEEVTGEQLGLGIWIFFNLDID